MAGAVCTMTCSPTPRAPYGPSSRADLDDFALDLERGIHRGGDLVIHQAVVEHLAFVIVNIAFKSRAHPVNSAAFDLGQDQVRVDGFADIVGADDLQHIDNARLGVDFQIDRLGADRVMHHGARALSGFGIQVGDVGGHELATADDRAALPAFDSFRLAGRK